MHIKKNFLKIIFFLIFLFFAHNHFFNNLFLFYFILFLYVISYRSIIHKNVIFISDAIASAENVRVAPSLRSQKGMCKKFILLISISFLYDH